MALEDTVEEIGELGVHAEELDEAEDGKEHCSAKEEGLRGNGPDDFAQRDGVLGGLLDIASVCSNHAHKPIQKVPG